MLIKTGKHGSKSANRMPAMAMFCCKPRLSRRPSILICNNSSKDNKANGLFSPTTKTLSSSNFDDYKID